MKVAHFSDLHYCERYLEWVDKAMRAGVDHAIAQKADCAVLSGDSLDSAITLHHPAVGRLITQVRRLGEYMPVFILQGTFSHDRPGCLDVFKHLRTAHPVHVCDVAERVALIDGAWETGFEPEDLAAGSARVVVSGFPSVNRADIQAVDPLAETASYVDLQMQAWAPGNLHLRSVGIPTLLVTHGTINGCVTESRQSMISQDHEFSAASLFSAETDATLIGHIHAHQSWTICDDKISSDYQPSQGPLKAARRIAYPGSITRLIYGHGARVGVVMWDVVAGGSEFVLFETPSRNLVDIEFNGPPDLAELARRLTGCRGGFVRLRYSVDEEHRKGVDTDGIKILLENAGLEDFKVEPLINPVQRTRSAGISTEDSTLERLKRWCVLTDTQADPLLERLSILETSA